MVNASVIKTLSKRDGRRAVLAMVRDALGILAAGVLALWLDNGVLTILSMWVIGAFQYAFGDLMIHEAAHGNLFANKPLNERLDILYGLPFCKPWNATKASICDTMGNSARMGII